jgi:hypothetical protein
MSIGSVGLGELGREALRNAPLLMSVADAKRALCVGHTKIYELINDGGIEAAKIGAKTCIVVASAVAFVERLRTTAQARKAASVMPFPETTTAAPAIDPALDPEDERLPARSTAQIAPFTASAKSSSLRATPAAPVRHASTSRPTIASRLTTPPPSAASSPRRSRRKSSTGRGDGHPLD